MMKRCSANGEGSMQDRRGEWRFRITEGCCHPSHHRDTVAAIE
jgi:hypothetical protein